MPEQIIRFGVFDEGGLRAATWKCWSPADRNDVYLTCRELRGALKASLHESGAYHIAYDGQFFDRAVRPEDRTEKGRFIEKWNAPPPLAPGISLLFRTVTTFNAVSTPAGKLPSGMVKLPKPSAGNAIEFSVFVLEAQVSGSDWPGKNSLKTSLVGSYRLPNGATVCVVSREIPQPKAPQLPGKPKFFEGRTVDHLKSENLRVLVFGEEPDGSRVLYDWKATLRQDNG